MYKLANLPPTPVATLTMARNIALEEGMKYPYVGNVPGRPGNNTYCPGCGTAVAGLWAPPPGEVRWVF